MRNQLRTTENRSTPAARRGRSSMPFGGFWTIFDTPFAELQTMEPKIEVSENNKNVMITAELPGVSEKDIDLQISANGYLTIKGEKRYKTEETIDGGYFSEISYGHISRTIPLPRELDYTKASALYDNGILSVTIPKTNQEQTSRQKIAVNARSEAKTAKSASAAKQKSNKQSVSQSQSSTNKRGRRKKQS